MLVRFPYRPATVHIVQLRSSVTRNEEAVGIIDGLAMVIRLLFLRVWALLSH
jgi:hypothetical protein